jgi:hypothetical protein
MKLISLVLGTRMVSGASRVAQVVERLHSKCETLSSNTSTEKKKSGKWHRLKS